MAASVTVTANNSGWGAWRIIYTGKTSGSIVIPITAKLVQVYGECQGSKSTYLFSAGIDVAQIGTCEGTSSDSSVRNPPDAYFTYKSHVVSGRSYSEAAGSGARVSAYAYILSVAIYE